MPKAKLNPSADPTPSPQVHRESQHDDMATKQMSLLRGAAYVGRKQSNERAMTDQREALRWTARADGYEIQDCDTLLVNDDACAGTTSRVALIRLFDVLRSGNAAIHRIYVEDIDLFSRSNDDLQYFTRFCIDCKQRGVEVRVVLKPVYPAARVQTVAWPDPVEIRTSLLLDICWRDQCISPDPTKRMERLLQSYPNDLTQHLSYLDNHGWIVRLAEGPPMPTNRGLMLAAAIEDRESLARFSFTLDA